MQKPNNTYSVLTIVKWLWASSKDNRWQAILNTLIGLTEVAVSLMAVWAVKRTVDIASHHIEGDVITAVMLMAALVVCNFALNIASVWVKSVLGIKAQNRMQRKLLARILRSEWRGRDAMHSGDVINRLEQDVNAVVNFMAETLPHFISVTAMLIGAFCYLYSMDRTLAIVILLISPLFLVFGKIFMKKMRELSRDVRDSDSIVQSLLQESVQSSLLVKTMQSEDRMVNRLDEQQTILRKKVIRKTKFSVTSNLIINTGFAFSYLVAFAWSALRMSAGTLSYGGMTAFLQLVSKIQSPARTLVGIVPTFIHVITSAERLMCFEEVPMEEQGEPVLLNDACGIKLENVTYAYTDTPEKTIIDNLSFDFKPGTCTAVVGETGAGKTTLIRMILALVKPSHGRVRIYNKVENRDVSPLTRCNIIYVPQGNTMMSGTIRDNLLLANPDATEEQMLKALNNACADFVLQLPEQLDTEVSEKGNGLSEGQAQRICIARALLREGNIMVMDEATSALDPETEKVLLENILKDKKHTVIFITHRLNVLEYCDQNLRIERELEK